MKVYDCWWTGLPDTHVGVEASSRNKAKAIVLRQANDAGYDAKYTEIHARVDSCAKVHYKESAATVA